MAQDNTVLIEMIKAAMSTEENGIDLVDVVRNAHKAEQQLAALQRYADMYEWNKIKRYFGMPKGGT